MSEWFENEEFWIDTYPFIFPEKLFQTADEDVEKALALVNYKEGSVLDLCCGPGRHALALAKRGIKVTAVDRTPFLLDKAREKGKADGIDVEWVLEDMVKFLRPDAFDYILNLYTSFGYFDNKEDDIKVLGNVFQSLKPGGAFLIDLMGKEILAKIFQPTVSTEYPGGEIIIHRHEIFDGWSRIRNEIIIVKDGKANSFNMHHTVYSGQELKDRLTQVGFSEVKLFGNFDGDAYDNKASRLIAVAWKPQL